MTWLDKYSAPTGLTTTRTLTSDHVRPYVGLIGNFLAKTPRLSQGEAVTGHHCGQEVTGAPPAVDGLGRGAPVRSAGRDLAAHDIGDTRVGKRPSISQAPVTDNDSSAFRRDVAVLPLDGRRLRRRVLFRAMR